MRAVPIRGADGKIVDFVDPRALETTEEAPNIPQETETTEKAPEPQARRMRSLQPAERKPLGDLLTTPANAPHANRSFTTGMVAGLLGALIVATLIVASRAPTSAPPTVTAATSAQPTVNAPTIAVTSAAIAPVATIIPPPTLGRALVAYAAPDGAVMGAISPDRAISLTGTFGSDWVQIHTSDSGAVWVKGSDLPTSVLDAVALATLPNLAPPPTATALPVPTLAPVAATIAPISPVQRCTPDRVVAIIERGVTQIASCVSLADAQASLPNSTVVAASAAEAQAFYDQANDQATALAKP